VVPRGLHSFPTRRSSDLAARFGPLVPVEACGDTFRSERWLDPGRGAARRRARAALRAGEGAKVRGSADSSRGEAGAVGGTARPVDRKSTRLNSSHVKISY